MKVTGFRTVLYEFAMDRPLGDANGPTGSNYGAGSFLFIDTDAGITGLAPGGGPAVQKFAPLIIGRDPRGVVGHWKATSHSRVATRGQTRVPSLPSMSHSGTSRPRLPANPSGECLARAMAGARHTHPASTSA
jgi:hypothetical protein